MNNDVFQLQAWFKGRVQGVGFRYQTLQIAQGYEVNGYVKNLSDGRVHLVAEGNEAEVVTFKDEVLSRMENFIKDVEIKTSQGPRQFSGFTIA